MAGEGLSAYPVYMSRLASDGRVSWRQAPATRDQRLFVDILLLMVCTT